MIVRAQSIDVDASATPIWSDRYFGVSHCHKSRNEWGTVVDYGTFATASVINIPSIGPQRHFVNERAAMDWVESYLFKQESA